MQVISASTAPVEDTMSVVLLPLLCVNGEQEEDIILLGLMG
jgi:hypothetical protein